MALKINELKVYYQTLAGEVKALDGLTFELKNGEIMGLAGESGCGKSTLSNSLILLKPPMKYISGTVELDGETLPIYDYQKMKNSRFKKISIIPQYAMNALNPTVKMGEYISNILENKGVDIKDIQDEVFRRLEIVGLSKNILKQYPVELSGGMKQRMVMVIATLLNPSLLLADEITSALDVSSQKAVSKLIVEFVKRKIVKSVIFVTHDVSVLYQIANKILIMYAGKFVELAETEKLIRNPLHPYTKLLVSSMPEVGIKYSQPPLSGIPGQPPSLLNPSEGCRFNERCPVSTNLCGKEAPPVREVEPGRFVACWKVQKNAKS